MATEEQKIDFGLMTNLWYVGMIKQTLWKNNNALSSLWSGYASHAAKADCFLRVSQQWSCVKTCKFLLNLEQVQMFCWTSSALISEYANQNHCSTPSVCIVQERWKPNLARKHLHLCHTYSDCLFPGFLGIVMWADHPGQKCQSADDQTREQHNASQSAPNS